MRRNEFKSVEGGPLQYTGGKENIPEELENISALATGLYLGRVSYEGVSFREFDDGTFSNFQGKSIVLLKQARKLPSRDFSIRVTLEKPQSDLSALESLPLEILAKIANYLDGRTLSRVSKSFYLIGGTFGNWTGSLQGNKFSTLNYLLRHGHQMNTLEFQEGERLTRFFVDGVDGELGGVIGILPKISSLRFSYELNPLQSRQLSSLRRVCPKLEALTLPNHGAATPPADECERYFPGLKSYELVPRSRKPRVLSLRPSMEVIGDFIDLAQGKRTLEISEAPESHFVTATVTDDELKIETRLIPENLMEMIAEKASHVETLRISLEGESKMNFEPLMACTELKNLALMGSFPLEATLGIPAILPNLTSLQGGFDAAIGEIIHGGQVPKDMQEKILQMAHLLGGGEELRAELQKLMEGKGDY